MGSLRIQTLYSKGQLTVNEEANIQNMKEKCNMAKVKVFLSFEFDRDEELHQNFYAQAAEYSSHKIEDYSLNEPYPPHNNRSWLKKARDLISRSDIVIAVIGEDTHNAPGVKKEVTIANQNKKSVFQIRPKNSSGGKVDGAGDEIPWDWKQIDAKISECLKR